MDAMPDRPLAKPQTRNFAAIGNLRAIVVLLVVIIHSMLAYLTAIGPGPRPFNRPPYAWRTFPIVDTHRFIGFDIFCAWNDAFLMALFFLVSGFFVWQGLERTGASRFVERRALRLGPPFILGIVLLMPLANYPAYIQTMPNPNVADYCRQLLDLPFWPAGPMWFLWFLLAFDVAAGLFYKYLPGQHLVVKHLSLFAQQRPLRFLAGLFVVSELAYLPFGYPFGPMNWLQFGPFSFQASFPGLYAVYFAAGVLIGASGLERGLIASDGPLARHWKAWSATALVCFAIWLFASAKAYLDPSGPSIAWKLAEALTLPPACFTSCCCLLAATTRFANFRSRALDHLQRNSFEIYLLHCVFVVWSQFALLGIDITAVPKAAIVFVVTLASSWAVASALRRLPIFGLMIGAGALPIAPLAPLPRPVLPLSD
jgi:peptidoglycan/LPS O-acetylase OafA/YrhL